METLLQPESVGAEARSVSEILAKSNPAGIPAMRTSLSFLTSAGAELATALEKREQELAELRAIITALPPEWVEAAKAGTSLPDVGALRAELQLAKDERDDLQAMLVERNVQAQALQDQIAQLEALPASGAEAELEQLKAQDVQVQADLSDRTAELEGLNARVAELQASLDQMSIARAGFENDLRDRDAELADIENQLAGMASELSQVQPSELWPRLWPRLHLRLWPRLHPRLWLRLHPRLWLRLHPRLWLRLHPRLWSRLHPRLPWRYKTPGKDGRSGSVRWLLRFPRLSTAPNNSTTSCRSQSRKLPR